MINAISMLAATLLSCHAGSVIFDSSKGVGVGTTNITRMLTVEVPAAGMAVIRGGSGNNAHLEIENMLSPSTERSAGVSLIMQTIDGPRRSAARWNAYWSDPNDTNRTSYLVLRLAHMGQHTERFRFWSDRTLNLLGIRSDEGVLYEFGTNVVFGGGVYNDSAGLKHSRVGTGPIEPGAFALITNSWATPFGDSDYTVSVAAEDSSDYPQGLSFVKIRHKTATGISVWIRNESESQLQGVIHLKAMHD